MDIYGIDNEIRLSFSDHKRDMWCAALKRKELSLPVFNIIRTRKGLWLKIV